MLRTPTVRVVLALALPVLAQQGLNLIVTLSDTFIAGRLETAPGAPPSDAPPSDPSAQRPSDSKSVQPSVQAARTNAHYLTWAISSFTILVTVGSTALVARFVGAGDRELARDVMHQSILLALVAGGLLSAVGLAGGIQWLVQMLNLKGEAAAQAKSYLDVLFVLLIFQIVESAGIACLVGAGDTRTGFFVMIGVAIVNIPLAWTFAFNLWPIPDTIVSLPTGFPGIALGTGLSHVLGCAAVMTVLVRGREGLWLEARRLVPRPDLAWRLLRVSLPAALDSLSMVAGQLWFLSIVNQIGVVESGAHGIALNWEALGYLSGAAFGTAAMSLVGQQLGAGRPDLARKSGYLALALGGGLMCFMGLVFLLLAPQMFMISTSDPGIVAEGVPVLRLVAFAMPALAPVIIFTSALRGAGDTRVPVIFTWVGFFAVRIPLAYILIRPEVDLGPLGVLPGANLGLFGAWLAMFVDIYIRGAFFVARFMRGRWQLQKV